MLGVTIKHAGSVVNPEIFLDPDLCFTSGSGKNKREDTSSKMYIFLILVLWIVDAGTSQRLV